MARLRILGKQPLQGKIKVSGAKNAAVALVPACILAGSPCRLENVPHIRDIYSYISILQDLGARVFWEADGRLYLDVSGVNKTCADSPTVQSFRASYYLMGALLARFHKAEVALPGGCNIGIRPIDQHVKGFEALGAHVQIEQGKVSITAEQLIGTTIYLDVVSVGATINIMLAAAGAQGTTIIENAAREPEIVDVANFLNGIGVKVRGAGTESIRIVGTAHRRGMVHSVIPDRIEAGTWMALAAATKSKITVENVIPEHLDAISAKLREMGVEIKEGADFLQLKPRVGLRAVHLKTLPYPGVATDMQSQIMVALLQAQGLSVVNENIFDNRFRYVVELQRMGADIKVERNMAMVSGPQSLTGASVTAPDLRGAAALVIAGLCAEGETVVEDIYHLERGYENVVQKLRGIGARIWREEDMPDDVTKQKTKLVGL